MRLDFNKIWEKIENLPWVALVTSGRNGSDYFQSLLDCHPEVFVFRGDLLFHRQFWGNSQCAKYQGKVCAEDILDEFIGKYIHKLKSKYDYLEGADQLGEDKNESININSNEFRKICVGLANLRPITSKYFLQSIYAAYALCLGQDIERKRIFFHHVHHIWDLDDYLKDFPQSKIISMTRDPRASFVSGVESFRRFNTELFDTPHRVFFTLHRIVEDAQPLKKYSNEFKVLRLETLEDEKVLKGVCKWLNIYYEPSMKESTWNGLRWYGDSLSVQPKYKDHEQFSKEIRRNKWKKKLNYIDKLLFNYLFADRLELFEYEFKETKGFWHGILIWFSIFIPTTYERRHLSLRFQIRWLKSRDYKNMLSVFYYYIKRIILFNKLFYNKHLGDQFNLPYFH
jgi:hypothetical protein